MRKVFFSIFILAFIFLLLVFSRESAFALDCTASYNPLENSENQPFIVTITNTTKGGRYHVFLNTTDESGRMVQSYSSPAQDATTDRQTLTFNIPGLKGGTHELYAQSFTIGDKACLKQQIFIKPTGGGSADKCVAWVGDSQFQTLILDRDKTATLSAIGNEIACGKNYVVSIDSDDYTGGYGLSCLGIPKLTFQVSTNKKDGQPLSNGSHVVTVSYPPENAFSSKRVLCSTTFAIGAPGAPAPPPSGTPFQPKLCEVNGDPKGGVDTAVGCIPTNPAGLVSFLLRLILGLSGGIALLLIIFSGYRMATAAGNPEALQGARETLTSAIVGLVFIILAIVILRIIGVEILRIPGFE